MLLLFVRVVVEGLFFAVKCKYYVNFCAVFIRGRWSAVSLDRQLWAFSLGTNGDIFFENSMSSKRKENAIVESRRCGRPGQNVIANPSTIYGCNRWFYSIFLVDRRLYALQ